MLTSATNPKILRLLQLRKDSSLREKEQSVLVIGEKFIRESMKVVPLKMLLSSAPLPEDMAEFRSCFFQAAPHLLAKITALSIQEGMIGEFAMPSPSPFTKVSKLLVLERISDPGNLGAIIRSQLAFGWDNLFLLPGCCDLFNEKVVRASAATLFQVHWRKGDWDELLAIVEQHQLTPLVADIDGKKVDQIQVKRPCLLVGNEASGISERAKCWGERVTIQMSQKVESLNAGVAASLLLYILR